MDGASREIHIDNVVIHRLIHNPPQNLVAKKNNRAVVLEWDAPATGNTGTLAGFRVFRDGVRITTPDLAATIFEYRDEYDFELEVEYKYDVRAVYTNPAGVSAPSNEVVVEFEPSPLSAILSTFTHVVTRHGEVILNWTTASENNLNHFIVLRNDVNDLHTATAISLPIKPEAKVSEATYTFTDNGVIPDNEYYYWLSVSFLDYSVLFTDEMKVEIDAAEVELPIYMTTIAHVYPNPMRVGSVANFDVAVKDNEMATLQIFNIRGQLVFEFKDIQQGRRTLRWNGMDIQNREVSSGVYFYRLSSQTTNSVQRMVIVK